MPQDFQVFAKPVGASCNLECSYCYYLDKKRLFPAGEKKLMSDEVLENYIVRHIQAADEPEIFFSWHGGEPTMAGLDFFRKAIRFQHKHKTANSRIFNGIQTNGTLIDENWCKFLESERFFVGLSMDGPPHLHNQFRKKSDGQPSHEHTIRGFNLLKKYGIVCEILCVVNSENVQKPIELYNYFRELGAKFITFLPLVERDPESENGVTGRSVPATRFGEFLCVVFDEWVENDIGDIKIQLFEEATRIAFGQDHTLCIFKQTCGKVPVIEYNGDLFSCDHFVNADHHLGNINERSLTEMFEDPKQVSFGLAKLNTLPQYCLECRVREMCNGECPKNRFILTPEGEKGLNYLCAGYKQFFSYIQPFVDEVASVWRGKSDR